MKNWIIPKMWPGETCVVLASGPSMSRDMAEQSRAAGKAIAVCRTFELAPWASLVYAADAMWWMQYYKQVATLCPEALKVCCDEGLPVHGQVHRLQIGAMNGFNPDPGKMNTGGNSGYQAICVAAHAGCKRILLCGFDMHGTHWHSDYNYPLRSTGMDTYQGWLPRFDTLKEPLRALGIDVINCTPNSALKTWRYLPLAEALQQTEVAAG